MSNTSQKFDISYLNYFIPNKRALYDILSDAKGCYLPEFGDKCITEDYLLKVAKGELFAIPAADIKRARLKKKPSCSDLYNKIIPLAKKPLGFDEDVLPEKRWLIDVLCTLNSHDDVFLPALSGIVREFPSG